MFARLILDYQHELIGNSAIVHADCFEWMAAIPADSIHAIVTDPPYGVKEYEFEQLEKRANGNGGIWRIPPAFDGSNRQPLPRFTALNSKERAKVAGFFTDWAKLAFRILRPGGHVFLACNAFLCQLVYSALVEGGLEFRGQMIRVVRTFRGGDRPKNAEGDFPDVCSLPRGAYEPWAILRKPLAPGMRLSDCLKQFETGGLRRISGGLPFLDILAVGRTPSEERIIAAHPSLKPQALLRALVYSALPLGRGTILDPFMGSGSTVAAAEAIDLACIGIERNIQYYEMAKRAIRPLSLIPSARDQLQLTFS